MDPQVNKKSNVFAYVLLGLIVFIVLILIFDKKNNLYKPSVSKETPASRQAIIDSLSTNTPAQNKISPEQKQSIIKYLSTDSSPSTTSSKKISADQKTQIINSVKAN